MTKAYPMCEDRLLVLTEVQEFEKGLRSQRNLGATGFLSLSWNTWVEQRAKVMLDVS